MRADPFLAALVRYINALGWNVSTHSITRAGTVNTNSTSDTQMRSPWRTA